MVKFECEAKYTRGGIAELHLRHDQFYTDWYYSLHLPKLAVKRVTD